MKKRLACRLALTYGLIFIIAVAVINIVLIFLYRSNQLQKNENYYMSLCSVLSSMAENNIRITDYIDTGAGFTDEKSGRVLLLDTDGKVILDSGGEMAGMHLTNPEFREASQKGIPAAGYYILDEKGMAMFSHPVLLSGRVSAVVLVSVYIQDIYDDINRFAKQTILISVMVAAIVIAASVWTGRRLSAPITKLTAAAEKISEGNTGTNVNIDRNDEIGVLADSFNKMSSELQKIEAGRKRFISDVSHELKTPLASIKALVEALLAGKTDSDECREYLGDVDHEIDRMSSLVSSLLTSARLEETMLKKEPLVLAEEVERVIKALRPLASQKLILLHNTCHHGVVVNADRNMLREVLINLIDNAIKYGLEGGYVKVECSNGIFKVIDNGCGILQQDLQSIFDSFYRVDRSRTGEGGSGIGLFIVKRIVELHGFDISVSSTYGEGSVFTVKFGDMISY